jgi:dimethylargininase
MIAITRGVPASIASCQLTHLQREPIDVEIARRQHEAYEELLQKSGCEIRRIEADERYPDCVFIEDTAVVLDEVAIITRPGAESRRGEVDAVAPMVAGLRPLVQIEAPATIDGGDVLVIDRTLFVGLSTRTEASAIEQLSAGVGPFGYHVVPVVVGGALHLKTAVTRVGRQTLLIDRSLVSDGAFRGLTLIDVDPAEVFAANALLVGETVVMPSAFPLTRRRLEDRGIEVLTVDASELAKAEGGVTCCSLLVTTRE